MHGVPPEEVRRKQRILTRIILWRENSRTLIYESHFTRWRLRTQFIVACGMAAILVSKRDYRLCQAYCHQTRSLEISGLYS